MESFRRSRLSIARYRILKESKLQLCRHIESDENQELLKLLRDDSGKIV
ncbi:MAG: hypothetical protein ACLU3W_09155 [Bacteroides ovatus]